MNETLFEIDDIENKIQQIEQEIRNVNIHSKQELHIVRAKIDNVKKTINNFNSSKKDDYNLFNVVKKLVLLEDRIDSFINKCECAKFNSIYNLIANNVHASYNQRRWSTISQNEFIDEWLQYCEGSTDYNYKYNQEQPYVKEEPFRFISYYIIFNHLYSYHYKQQNDIERQRNPRYQSPEYKEHEVMKKYIEYVRKKGTPNNIFNPFIVLGENSPYFKKYVRSSHWGPSSEEQKRDMENKLEKIKNKNLTDGVVELFSAIYRVRCNMFHGNKTIIEERDVGLIEDGSKILRYLIHYVVGR